MINRAALVCGSETKGQMTSNLERRYEGIHHVPYLLSSSCPNEVGGLMAREPMSRSGAMPRYVWDIIETSRVGP